MPDLSQLTPGQPILLQGNQAIARGALEAGVRVAAAYPGNPSSEILESLAEAAQHAGMYVEWSANEKVALEVAAAASYAGLRAMASMKQNGVNVALDFICNLTISGCRAGMVLVACDDPGAISSTNEQDSRFVARLADLPMLEPSTAAEAQAMMHLAFDLSEEIGNLVVVRSLGRLSHSRAVITPKPLPDNPPLPFWDPKQVWVTMPVLARHRAMHEKLARAGLIMAQSGFNAYDGPEKPDLLIIASGLSALYAAEAVALLGQGERVGLLKLGCTWPLDEDRILGTMAKADQVLIAEELDPFLENEVKALYAQHAPRLGIKRFFGRGSGHLPREGELSPGKLASALSQILGLAWQAAHPAYAQRAAQLVEELVPPREVAFCPGCPHRASYWAIKQALALDNRAGLVSGDIGCYTLGARATGFNRVNSVHCMGSGLGISSGLGQLHRLGFTQPIISVVGDSTFYHAALPALVNAKWNQADYLLVVLDNSATAMTGFQPHPGTGVTATGAPGSAVEVEEFCRGLGLDCQVADPYDLMATQEALYEALQQKGLRVLILRRVCALVQNKRGGHPFKVSVDQSKCRGDACGCHRFCTRVFRCPGLYFDEEEGRARIDEVVCVGCGVCSQLCPAGAIQSAPKEAAA